MQPLGLPTSTGKSTVSCFAICVIKPSVQRQSVNPVRDLLFPNTAGRVAGSDRVQRTEVQRQKYGVSERLEDLSIDQNQEQTDQ